MASARIVTIVVLTSWSLFGQPAAPPPAFEVATVKPNASGDGGTSRRFRGSQIQLENYSLKQLIQLAFAVKDFSLIGPTWMETVRFDVLAKPPESGGPVNMGLGISPNYTAMLQTLLTDRFQLQFHRETKELSAYALLVDKKGAKIEHGKGVQAGTTSGRGLLGGTNLSMAEFADLLSANVDRPVRDLTGLEGKYDLKLRWAVDDTASTDDSTRSPTATSLFAAIQEQLGLRLEARKLAIEILIIDHAGKVPTAN